MCILFRGSEKIEEYFMEMTEHSQSWSRDAWKVRTKINSF